MDGVDESNIDMAIKRIILDITKCVNLALIALLSQSGMDFVTSQIKLGRVLIDTCGEAEASSINLKILGNGNFTYRSIFRISANPALL